MNVTLTQYDLREILTEKFGDASFTISYIEPDELWEERSGLKTENFRSLQDFEAAAGEKISFVIRI